jgi:hypothetical protein
LHEQGINFKQDLFIWEDVDFNVRVADVCKCYRFVMVKKPYDSGGCADHIARSENPHVRAEMVGKFTPDQIAIEALERTSLGYDVQKKKVTVSKKSGAVVVESTEDAAREAAALLGKSVFELEADPALQPEGAVCDESGNLVKSYYKKFVEAFKDKERLCADLTTGTVNRRPGMRQSEEWPEGLRVWDDTRRSAQMHRIIKTKGGTVKQLWGAGWISSYPFRHEKGQRLDSTWFNVRIWKTWRLSFVLARLQHAVWMAKGHADGLEVKPSIQTPTKRKRKDLSAPSSAQKATMKRKRKNVSAPNSEQKDVVSRRKRKTSGQPTLLNFFGKGHEQPKKSEMSATPQPSIKNFFRATQRKLSEKES